MPSLPVVPLARKSRARRAESESSTRDYMFVEDTFEALALLVRSRYALVVLDIIFVDLPCRVHAQTSFAFSSASESRMIPKE